MIRRFNYTGRKKIPRAQISITLYEAEGKKLAFDASVDFKGIILPQDGNIFIEAYRRAYLKRYECGSVRDPRFPKNEILEGLDSDSLVRFRLKVVDKKGRIVAIADKISPHRLDKEEPANRLCLLHVDFLDLGQLIWRLDLDGDWPILLLNKNVENIREIARSDLTFLALVYPEIVRQILYKTVVDEDHTDPETDGEEDWMSAWLRFALSLVGRKQLPPSGESEPVIQEKLKWIDEVVDAFCSNHQTLEKFSKSLKIRES